MNPTKPEQLPVWFSTGECTNLGVDVGIMVPEVDDREAENIAKAVCMNCDIQELCLGWAMKNRRNDLGVYGGKTAHERFNLGRKVRREHARG